MLGKRRAAHACNICKARYAVWIFRMVQHYTQCNPNFFIRKGRHPYKCGILCNYSLAQKMDHAFQNECANHCLTAELRRGKLCYHPFKWSDQRLVGDIGFDQRFAHQINNPLAASQRNMNAAANRKKSMPGKGISCRNDVMCQTQLCGEAFGKRTVFHTKPPQNVEFESGNKHKRARVQRHAGSVFEYNLTFTSQNMMQSCSGKASQTQITFTVQLTHGKWRGQNFHFIEDMGNWHNEIYGALG
jgi:hypothetical protein